MGCILIEVEQLVTNQRHDGCSCHQHNHTNGCIQIQSSNLVDCYRERHCNLYYLQRHCPDISIIASDLLNRRLNLCRSDFTDICCLALKDFLVFRHKPSVHHLQLEGFDKDEFTYCKHTDDKI